MIRSDLAASGVMFTIDTESGFRNCRFNQLYLWLEGKISFREKLILMNSISFKPTEKIIYRALGKKALRIDLLITDPTKPVKDIDVPLADQNKIFYHRRPSF